ncbi:hypothetical protein [Methylomonas koyamae]|nr:hypothetical protein [Methylomonas koyamae]
MLHAYKISAADLGNYAAPVPVPAAVWLFGTGMLATLRLSAKRKLAA